ncbi:MAG: hypothetical protein LCH57_08395 [Proteobacteria bacterium]|nr:hypothetical protein [Pseudomonadota bacterium]
MQTGLSEVRKGGGFVVEYLEAEAEAEIAEILELLLHRQQRLVWLDPDGNGIELAGVALQFWRKCADLFSDLVLGAEFGLEHQGMTIARCRNAGAHDRLHAQDVERDRG